MRLLLIGNYLPDRQNSMQRYAALLEREMLARGHEVKVLRPGVVLGGGGSKWLGYVDKYLLFPLVAWWSSRGWDTVHVCDHSNAVYLPWLPEQRRSVTCHDVLAIESARGRFPQQRTGATGRILQGWIAKNLLRAERIVAVSGATAERLRVLGARGEVTTILSPTHTAYCVAGDASVIAIRQKLGLSGRFLLHVGNNNWYKNRPGAARIGLALKQLQGFEDLRLVFAGAPWSDELKSVLHGDDAVEALGLSDAEIAALYSEAEALLFPSLEEGYGWPVAEAQSCGCVVITSNRAPMTEVAGDAAIFVDPENAEAAAREIAVRWADRSELRKRGFENLKRLAVEPAMEAYEKFFQREEKAYKVRP